MLHEQTFEFMKHRAANVWHLYIDKWPKRLIDYKNVIHLIFQCRLWSSECMETQYTVVAQNVCSTYLTHKTPNLSTISLISWMNCYAGSLYGWDCLHHPVSPGYGVAWGLDCSLAVSQWKTRHGWCCLSPSAGTHLRWEMRRRLLTR